MKFDIVVANPPFSLDKWGHEDAEADPFNRFHRGLPPKSQGRLRLHHPHDRDRPRRQRPRRRRRPPRRAVPRRAPRARSARSSSRRTCWKPSSACPPISSSAPASPPPSCIFNKGKTARRRALHRRLPRLQGRAKTRTSSPTSTSIKSSPPTAPSQTVEKYAYRATPQELADNDFNLNIPRYVDTFEEEAEIDLDAVKKEITALETELAAVRAKMQAYLEELGV